MELNEIITLINAGYTKEEIEKLSETKPEAKTEAVDLEDYVKGLNDRLGKLVDTVGAMQADNIAKADAGEPAPKPTFEELVANFTKDM